jgi:hypothetical protein
MEKDIVPEKNTNSGEPKEKIISNQHDHDSASGYSSEHETLDGDHDVSAIMM